MSRFTRFFWEIIFFKKNLKYGQNMGSWRYRFKCLDRIGLHWLFHGNFGEITFLKWDNVSNSNLWFLARLSNGFSRRFAFTQANTFFLKSKSILIEEKSIFHVSNLNVRELDCGKFWYVSEWLLTRKFCNSSATIQSQNKSKTTWEIEVQEKSKVSCS